ncbi:MAG: hypothetical protein A2051_13195 [Desulfovibrionales bacterium GWA2_65_9]|nr:MAG: hypothetical protein A2051_13195 [Desulfovibrionales bacterium GWA2_65_9]
MRQFLHLAEALSRLGLTVVWFSSDYVFDGLAEAYPDDAPDDAMTTPLNEYGRQKAEVERLLPEVCQGNCLILRLGKVYGTTPGDGSLLDEMATLLLAGREVRAGRDQIFCQIHVEDLAAAVLALQAAGARGLFNLCAPGARSRLDIARLVARTFGAPEGLVRAISLDDLGERFQRPKRVVLETRRLAAMLADMPGLCFRPLEQAAQELADAYAARGRVAELCHVCGAEGLLPLPGLDGLGLVSSDCRPLDFRCQLALCPACGVVQKRVDETWRVVVARIYDEYCIYHQSGGQEQPVFLAGGGACARSDRLLDWALEQADLPEQGRLADVGCGNGGFLRAFAERRPGWRLCGLEWGGRHQEAVLDIPGVAEFSPEGLAGLDDLTNLGGRLDALVLVHALEHLPEPRAALARLHDSLEPGGLLLVLVPDHASNPFDLLIADHCTHFSAGSLRRELVRAGFAVEALAEGTAIAKELAVLARRVERAGPAAPPVLDMPSTTDIAEARQRAEQGVGFLGAVLVQARAAARQAPVGVFGTSIGGVWLAAQLGPAVAFFVDEDEDRVGRELMGLPVLAPGQVAAGATVILPLAPAVAQAVLRRFAPRFPGVRWLVGGSG